MTIVNRTKTKSGCPKCSNRHLCDENSFATNPDSDWLHPTLNTKTANELHKAGDEKVVFLCKCVDKYGNRLNHIFETTLGHFSAGSRCPQRDMFGYSKVSIRWLNYVMESQEINIQHAENGGEYRILGTNWRADGYCKETNTIYEFHGTYWHGDPNKYHGDRKNEINKNKDKTFGELYDITIEREKVIKSLGYNLEVMWESEFMRLRPNK